VEYKFKAAKTLGKLIASKTEPIIRLVSGQFDEDDADELLVAYNDADARIAIELYDVEGAALVMKTGETLLALPQTGIASGNNVDESARFDVATGDVDGDGLDEIIIGTAREITEGCTFSNGCWEAVAFLYRYVGDAITLLGSESIFSKEDNSNRWMGRVAVETGDFDGDDLDEIAMAIHVPHNGSTHRWYVEGLTWDTETAAFLTTPRLDAEQTLGSYGFALSLVTGTSIRTGAMNSSITAGICSSMPRPIPSFPSLPPNSASDPGPTRAPMPGAASPSPISTAPVASGIAQTPPPLTGRRSSLSGKMKLAVPTEMASM